MARRKASRARSAKGAARAAKYESAAVPLGSSAVVVRTPPDRIQRLADAIRELDPDRVFVVLDAATRTVRYSSEFILHEAIATFASEEEPARAYIVCWLCTKAGYLPSNIELEKRYSIGRPKAGAELDILVKRPDGTSYALIEVKAASDYDSDADKFIRGQLFNIAPHESGSRVLSYATVDLEGALA